MCPRGSSSSVDVCAVSLTPNEEQFPGVGLVSSQTNHMLWRMFHNTLTQELITLIITFPLHSSIPLSPSILLSLSWHHLIWLIWYIPIIPTPPPPPSLYCVLIQHICCFWGKRPLEWQFDQDCGGTVPNVNSLVLKLTASQGYWEHY